MKTPPHDWLLLALTPGIGPAGFLRLIDAFGGADAALNANSRQTEPLIGKEAADALQRREAAASAEAALEWAQTPGCQLVSLLDDDYPPQLAESNAPPPLLFARGRRELLAEPMLAIVGSRAATPQASRTRRASPATWRNTAIASSAAWPAASTPRLITARSGSRPPRSPWSAPA